MGTGNGKACHAQNLFEEYLERVRDEASQSEAVITSIWRRLVVLQKGMVASPRLGCPLPLGAACAQLMRFCSGWFLLGSRAVFQLAHKCTNTAAGKEEGAVVRTGRLGWKQGGAARRARAAAGRYASTRVVKLVPPKGQQEGPSPGGLVKNGKRQAAITFLGLLKAIKITCCVTEVLDFFNSYTVFTIAPVFLCLCFTILK